MHEARRTLRDATRSHHDRVDAAFGDFDLGERGAYTAFLSAHSAAVVPSEAMIATADLWNGWTPRSAALIADLAELGAAPAPAMPLVPPATTAELWGMIYVLEGSRLGGVVLAERVGPGLPRRYLESRHVDGGWRAFQAALEAARNAGDADWLPSAVRGAEAAFTAFETAARLTLSLGPKGQSPGTGAGTLTEL
jgi:heme oxygenase